MPISTNGSKEILRIWSIWVLYYTIVLDSDARAERKPLFQHFVRMERNENRKKKRNGKMPIKLSYNIFSISSHSNMLKMKWPYLKSWGYFHFSLFFFSCYFVWYRCVCLFDVFSGLRFSECYNFSFFLPIWSVFLILSSTRTQGKGNASQLSYRERQQQQK